MNPPYIPPEFENCTKSQLPEPYRTQMDDWIAFRMSEYQAGSASARDWLVTAIVIFGAVGFIVTGLILMSK